MRRPVIQTVRADPSIGRSWKDPGMPDAVAQIRQSVWRHGTRATHARSGQTTPWAPPWLVSRFGVLS